MMGLSRASKNLATVGVESRKARKHYGLTLSVPYDNAKHKMSEK
jgi:hypothetical protein